LRLYSRLSKYWKQKSQAFAWLFCFIINELIIQRLRQLQQP
jgi:hypothetical protein